VQGGAVAGRGGDARTNRREAAGACTILLIKTNEIESTKHNKNRENEKARKSYKD
jgi:hypothetical protein